MQAGSNAQEPRRILDRKARRQPRPGRGECEIPGSDGVEGAGSLAMSTEGPGMVGKRTQSGSRQLQMNTSDKAKLAGLWPKNKIPKAQFPLA